MVPALVQSATFFGGRTAESEVLYTRYGNNPNQLHVARKIAALEGTEDAVVLSSGMAATSMTFLALVGQGGHIVASQHLYGATRTLLQDELPRRGIRSTFVDPADRRSWADALEPDTRMLFLEIPTNPTLRVFDPEPIVGLAAEHDLLTAADATFASPVNLRLAEHGVDVVIHSATKYLGGHSDIIAGVVASSSEHVAAVVKMMTLYGPAVDPHTAWLLDRGLRTLDVRIQRQNRTALALASWFEQHPGVVRVHYPGLASHPDHETAAELLDGFGGMLAFELVGGGPAADGVMERLCIGMVAPSLGSVETLLSQPRHTSHIAMSADERASFGIPDGFVRVSVGVENEADLIADFEQALAGLE